MSHRVLACLARTYLIPACLLLASFAATAAVPATTAPVSGSVPGSVPGSVLVPMAAQPGTALDKTARSLIAQDLAEARQSGRAPLLLVGSARLGNATDRPALFIQLQSPRECGSAGCSTSAYAWIKAKSGGSRWTKVLDAVSGQVAVARTRHRGMADLIVDSERYAWTGTAYASTRPAPTVDLRPRTPAGR